MAAGATVSAAAVAAPPYSLTEVERGTLRTGCPVVNDAGQMAFLFRDAHLDSEPADGLAFWSAPQVPLDQVRLGADEVLGELIGLTGAGAAVVSMAAGPAPDFTGVARIRRDGQVRTRPAGSTVPMHVRPVAVTEGGRMLLQGVVDGFTGAFLATPNMKVQRQRISSLGGSADINESGAGLGGAWVDSEDRFASYWRSPQGVVQRLAGLPGTGDHDQTRARSLNDLDAIVGVTTFQTGHQVATLWDTPTSAPRELRPPAGSERLNCSAYSINNLREVVGSCSGNQGKNPRAFYWSEATGMLPLASLLPASAVAAGAQVLENNCISINHHGAIAFALVDEGSAGGRPALLQPLP